MPIVNNRYNIDDAVRFSVSSLNNLLKKDQVIKQVISLDKGNKIQVEVNSINEFINLNYTYQKKPVNQFIELESKTTNLGNGFIWYFLCPVTAQRCRNLYLAFDSMEFKSKEAYAQLEQKMYYPTQIQKPSEYAIFRNTQLASDYENFSFKNLKKTYRGKQTSTLTKYNKMIDKLDRFTDLTNKQLLKKYNL